MFYIAPADIWCVCDTGHCHSEAVGDTGVTAVPEHSNLASVRRSAECITRLCTDNRQQKQRQENLKLIKIFKILFCK